MSYVYIKTEPKLWTTGFYKPDGDWEPDQDFSDPSSAAIRVAFLNGSAPKDSFEAILDTIHRISDLESALKTASVAMDLEAGWKIDEAAFKRVEKRYGGGMAGAYIKVCEALVAQKEGEINNGA